MVVPRASLYTGYSPIPSPRHTESAWLVLCWVSQARVECISCLSAQPVKYVRILPALAALSPQCQRP
eukprot:2883247-Rhodomonas_salina.1